MIVNLTTYMVVNSKLYSLQLYIYSFIICFLIGFVGEVKNSQVSFIKEKFNRVNNVHPVKISFWLRLLWLLLTYIIHMNLN